MHSIIVECLWNAWRVIIIEQTHTHTHTHLERIGHFFEKAIMLFSIIGIICEMTLNEMNMSFWSLSCFLEKSVEKEEVVLPNPKEGSDEVQSQIKWRIPIW